MGMKLNRSKINPSVHEHRVKGQCSAEIQSLGLREGEQGFLAGGSYRSELMLESSEPG